MLISIFSILERTTQGQWHSVAEKAASRGQRITSVRRSMEVGPQARTFAHTLDPSEVVCSKEIGTFSEVKRPQFTINVGYTHFISVLHLTSK